MREMESAKRGDIANSSSSRSNSSNLRFVNATATLCNDSQSLVADIRKALAMLRTIAVDLERAKEFEKVKELEGTVLELLKASDDAAHFSLALQSIGDNFVPSDQLTDFDKLIEAEMKKSRANIPSAAPQSNPLFRQFKEAVWNVHHSGEPMPGDEQEEVVMTSTQCNLLNDRCPLTGKPVINLDKPVRSMDCKHVYDKQAILGYINSSRSKKCPIAGCPRILVRERVVCDPLLQLDIDDLREMNTENIASQEIEDCT